MGGEARTGCVGWVSEQEQRTATGTTDIYRKRLSKGGMRESSDASQVHEFGVKAGVGVDIKLAGSVPGLGQASPTRATGET